MSFPPMDCYYRAAVGKGPARRLRANGLVPGIVYGPGAEPLTIAFSPKTLRGMLGGERKLNTIIEMRISGVPSNGGEETVVRTVIVKERQFHPMRANPEHVDFYAVSMEREMFVEVPLEFTGTAIGVDEGGNVQVQRRSITVRCLPDRIPSSFVVDISALDIGDAIHALDVKMPEGVRPGFEHNFALISCLAPEKEEEVAVVEGVEGEVAAVEGAAPAAEGPAPAKEGDEKKKDDKKKS